MLAMFQDGNRAHVPQAGGKYWILKYYLASVNLLMNYSKA